MYFKKYDLWSAENTSTVGNNLLIWNFTQLLTSQLIEPSTESAWTEHWSVVEQKDWVSFQQSCLTNSSLFLI